MTFASHNFFSPRGIVSVLLPLGIVAAIGLLVGFVFLFSISWRQQETPAGLSVGGPPAAEVAAAPRVVPELSDSHFMVFNAGPPGKTADATFLNDYRFAGTFFLYGASGQQVASFRRAVLAYLPDNEQFVVMEGEMVRGAEVVEIHEDRLLLRKDGVEGALFLRESQMLSNVLDPGRRERVADPPDSGTGETTRFGQRLREGYWELNRESLMAYYDELLDEPERLLHVFDSMAPLYTEEGRIEGYELNTVGEADFFAAVGFQEGDRVREVNSLPMTSRRRAEYFIRQVVESQLSAVVIDMERNGEKKRIVYQIR